MLEDKRNAFKNIVNKYSNLESMLESIGIDKSEIDNWYNVKITSSYEEFKKVFKKERNHIYISTILGIFSFLYMFVTILFFHHSFIYFFIMSIIFLLIDIFVIRKFKNNNSKETYSVDYYEKFERLFDKYTKRSAGRTTRASFIHVNSFSTSFYSLLFQNTFEYLVWCSLCHRSTNEWLSLHRSEDCRKTGTTETSPSTWRH